MHSAHANMYPHSMAPTLNSKAWLQTHIHKQAQGIGQPYFSNMHFPFRSLEHLIHMCLLKQPGGQRGRNITFLNTATISLQL